MMIEYFIRKVHGRKSFSSPRVVICVPYGLTQVERKAVRESAMNAGARYVYLIEEPMAAAIGAGLPVRDPQGNLVVDIGGGTTEIGVISLGGLVISKSIRVAGDKLDAAIVDYVKKNFNLLIGDRVAEDLKIKIGTAIKLDEELSTVVRGRDQVEGTLTSVEITSEHIREAIADPLKQIAEALKTVLEQTPPDLAGDIVENGIVLTGGGALIRGLDKYLSDIVKLPVYIAEDPLLAVAKGTGKALDELDLLQQTAFED
jgi:rod shape-determining protein MreB